MKATDNYEAVYHRLERMWYLWDGHEAILEDDGSPRLFLTAQNAYDWLASYLEVMHATD
jgi:hypothetical protein